jgi:hypothetical protein
VEIYFMSMSVPKNPGSGTLFGGRYIDRLERRSGEWRIAAREFIPHFSTRTEPNFTEFFEGWYKGADPACSWGPTGRHDVAYVRPLPARKNKEAGPPCAGDE